MTTGTIVAQSNGKQENSAVVAERGYGWASPRRVEVKTTTMHGEPISYKGDSVIFDPRRMVIGFPHVFRFLDHYMAVIKSQDGTLNFFYFDNPEDEAVE